MKHIEIIKVWLDGAEWYLLKNAEDTTEVDFKDTWEYLIKPIETTKNIPLTYVS